MGAVDPTYPLYPIACILASAMLLLVLTNSFTRQSWNLGVTFLCFWLFLENLTFALNAIIWSDNADVKLYVYCDIVSHLQVIAYVVKPMSTLIITRRLYLIASLQSVKLPSEAARRWDLAVEWTLGLIVPLLVAGPIYYVNQGRRFVVNEGFGCTDAPSTSIVQILTQQSWAVLPPMISIIFYYPKVARTYYRQSRAINRFLRSDPSLHINYLRILALANIDILLALPIGIVNITLGIVATLSSSAGLPVYRGWTYIHTDWEPVGFSYAQLQALGTAALAQTYFVQWTSPVLAFAIFALFGITSQARASYWHAVCIVGGWFGWKPVPRASNRHTTLSEIEFGVQPHRDTSTFTIEIGSRSSSFVDNDAPVESELVKIVLGGSVECPAESKPVEGI